uniref:Uncharacterized protein n=1 Tax=Anguilla anguilla TaxID=7936 RepID=A0A0E9U3Z6_ANGAN
MDEEEESVKDASDFVGLMLAAATSKTCATSIAYPHEVIRTRLREEGDQVPVFLPDTIYGYQGGGLPCPVPRSDHSPGAADPQHGNHDVHLRAGRLPAEWLALPSPAQRERDPPRNNPIRDQK